MVLNKDDRFLMPSWWPEAQPCGEPDTGNKAEWHVVRVTKESAAVKRTAKRVATIKARFKTVHKNGLTYKVPIEPTTTTIVAEDVRLTHISRNALVERVVSDGTVAPGNPSSPDNSDPE